jgi:polyferredoxin
MVPLAVPGLCLQLTCPATVAHSPLYTRSARYQHSLRTLKAEALCLRLPELSVIAQLRLVRQLYGTVIVAVVAIGVMEVAFHDVVNVLAVRNRLVAAVCTVLVTGLVAVALVTVGAVRRILCVDVELVLIDVALVERMQVAVVEVVSVVVVNDGRVTAVLAVLMGMVLVDLMQIRHGLFLSRAPQGAS